MTVRLGFIDGGSYKLLTLSVPDKGLISTFLVLKDFMIAWFYDFMVFDATFNNISVISLAVSFIGGGNQSTRRKLNHIILYRVHREKMNPRSRLQCYINIFVPSFHNRHDITEIVLKVALNTINQPYF
jgi:hypothetical protein